ncbi:glycoside hydrolase family 130 protein [Stetteria hydrogenophila]
MYRPRYGLHFKRAQGFREAATARRFETEDIVRRLGVIAPHRIYLNNYPVSNPVAAFNPSLIVDNDEAIIYARIIVGYYMYVSAIVALRVPLEDLYSGSVNMNRYACQLAVYPSTRYDLWGTEDPRVYELDGKLYMTYTGRTVNYFDPRIHRERTVPVTAVRVGNYHVWRKVHVYVLPPELREHVVSDKDAFLVDFGGDLLLFHRPHMDDDSFYLTVSRVDLKKSRDGADGLKEVTVDDTVWVTDNAAFESRIGWATPPIRIGSNEIIALLHGVDNDLKAYRLYAMLLEYSKTEGIIVKAVTPTYIMEPKLPYEVFGDRPYTIFPCGLWRLEGDRFLISYGAGDYMIGLGEIDLDELLGLLDKGRIY